MSVVVKTDENTPLIAVQRAWDYVREEIEASDPAVGQKRVPFLSRLYHAINRTFGGISEQVADGSIDPYASLRSLAYDGDPTHRECHDIDRPIRVGFFPIGGNPVWWGHILSSLMAMDALGLDTLVYRIQGEIRYKDLPETDRVPVSDRHEIAREVIDRFFPLIRYTDLGSEPDNDREGAEEMHRYFELNSDRRIHMHYLLGIETRERVERYFAQQYQAAARHDLGSNPNHRLTIGWIQRGEYGAEATADEIERISHSQQGESDYGQRIKSALVQDPSIDLNVSSTYYRNTHDDAIVPRLVHEHAKTHGFYGHPPIDPRTGAPFDYSEDEHFRLKLRPVTEGMANQIVRLSERDGTEASIVVSIDGPSGSGKTSIAQEVAKYLALRDYESVHIPFDIYLWDKDWRSGMEKLILGDALNPVEREAVGDAAGQVEAAETYCDEETFWDVEARERLVRELARFRQSGAKEITLVVQNGYDRPTKENREFVYTVKRGSVVLIEGKYCNREELAPNYDIRYRLVDHPDRTKAKFEMRTRSLSPNTADSQMRFYDVGLIPSYARYAERTHEFIDCTIDLYGDEWRLVKETPSLETMLACVDDDTSSTKEGAPAVVREHARSGEAAT